MARYRTRLPQLGKRAFLTDGSLATALVFHNGWKLPVLEAFTLANSERGRAAILAYYEPYLQIAVRSGCGFVLEAPTWRANPDWAGRVGYDRKALEFANRTCIALMERLRAAHETERSPMPISGCVGPRDDSYDADTWMSANEAEAYHTFQVDVLADTEADMITAMTMTNINEAIGIVRATQRVRMPSVVSFTVETDGRLPSGETLKGAIVAVDGATRNGPAYYMINCAHPTHFADALVPGEEWTKRVRGLRANAIPLSRSEPHATRDLEAADPAEFARQYRDILRNHPHIVVLGGCRGTDHRHVEQAGLAWLEDRAAA